MHRFTTSSFVFFLLLSAASILVYFRVSNTGSFYAVSNSKNHTSSAGDTLVMQHQADKFGSVCHTPRCIAMYESVSGRSNRVPSIRHILWKSDRVSAYFAKQLKSWGDIHPDWQYILWRDSDLDRFVARHFTGVLTKFRSLPQHIMRVDMIRYMILHRFGGVYADLDYTLVQPLDRFLKFPAVVTRVPEALSLFHFGMGKWPPPVFGSPAFMMSEPQHPFFNFCIHHLLVRPVHGILEFAGPIGLTDMLQEYCGKFPATESADGIVYVPASRNFYPYDGNSMHSSTSVHKQGIIDGLRRMCRSLSLQSASNLTRYCRDVYDLNPITDPSDPVYAIHDNNKSRSSYDAIGSAEFQQKHQVDIRSVLPNLVMADTII